MTNKRAKVIARVLWQSRSVNGGVLEDPHAAYVSAMLARSFLNDNPRFNTVKFNDQVLGDNCP